VAYLPRYLVEVTPVTSDEFGFLLRSHPIHRARHLPLSISAQLEGGNRAVDGGWSARLSDQRPCRASCRISEARAGLNMPQVQSRPMY
jgi:hypothetical protein